MASECLIQPSCSYSTNIPAIYFLNCDSKELNLDVVLLNGQSFRWKKDISDPKKLIGVACHRVWKIWRIDDNQIAFQVLTKFPLAAKIYGDKSDEEILKDYFQLNVNLSTLYSNWQALDPHFSSIFESSDKKFEGIRILQQPLLETIFSFICSANNNITRISNMVNTLASLYGDKIAVKVDETNMKDESQDFYDFPSIEQMAKELNGMEKILRDKGFGYRAKYIAKSVKRLLNIEGGYADWEKRLKDMEYSDAKIEIQKLEGVGPKVADCICLMALNQHHVVPVDTHVFQITALHYLPELKKSKSVTDVIYKRITEFYAERFGSYAGWAHSCLFSTRLKRFQLDEKPEGDNHKLKKKK